MRKTKLSLDTLRVETFETHPAAVEMRGTVHAHLTQAADTCGGRTCDAPCKSTFTFYMTCQQCSTNAYEVCLEPWTRQSGCTDGLDCTA